MSESFLVWSSAISYGLGSLPLLLHSKKNTLYIWAAFILLVSGVTMLFVALAGRWNQLGQGPFMTMYEVLLSNAFSIGFIYSILFYFIPLCRYAFILVLPFLFMMTIWALNVSPEPVPLPATFDNIWLWFHVLSGKIFLGFCLTAVSLSTILLLNHTNIKSLSFDINNQTTNLDLLVWRLMSIAFIADSTMLVVGSIWAYDAWGRYWAWDPLETWAFVTWLSLGISLHIRLTFNTPAWAGWLMTIFVFTLAFLTFFGVPFLSLAPHKGVL